MVAILPNFLVDLLSVNENDLFLNLLFCPIDLLICYLLMRMICF